ncbi:coiled-coil domain-containing protein 66 isoform X2 [Mugil cephalus]|uniref:coiled-coil domain-containing protein 66 isoform X2 n=1 Tax=Mugil cephalus TaxID=48193 RepID=UPI001FB56EA4|nr:coiled-coil domain-containing protein 66 isoform X2 [Mugil cephalus]
MNLGDGLLFELENGKPRLILLSHGADKKTVKPPYKPRAANVLSCRQPSCVEEVHAEERPPRQLAGRHKEAKHKAGGAAASCTSNTEWRSTTLTSLKSQDHPKGTGVKSVPKGKADRQKHTGTVGSQRVNGKTAQSSGSQDGRNAGRNDALSGGDAGLKDSVVCLTNEQLQQILSSVQASSNNQQPAEDQRTQGNEASSKCDSLGNGGGGGGGGEEEEDRGGGSQDKHDRPSGCLLSWMEGRQLDDRKAIDAKKAQWKRELDEQVALKQQQQRSAPSRLQMEEDTQSVLSVQSSVSHREQPAAIRSSLRLGEVSPMEEVLSVERKEEQRRRWLEELDRQREETSERRRREKLLQNQTEDHELWATHFDSLQRRPLVRAAAPSAPPCGSERGEWEPSSSLSLWEATSSFGAESVGAASIDTTSGYPAKTSYLRTMTSLLDPVQIEEREKRRLKQLEQQRAIEAQMEERRRQKEQEEAKKRQEEQEEERRIALEREMLQRQYELDALRERQKEQSVNEEEQPKTGHDDVRVQETTEPSVTARAEGLEDTDSPASSYRDTAVQTEAAPSLPHRDETPDVLSARLQPPPSGRSRALRTGKENVCVSAGGDPYEAFARTERNRRDKRRPEWNTQRPSRRFVPASERYPAALQRNRQESRLKRQAELLALQERTCLSRTDPPPPPPPPQQQNESRLGLSQTRTSPSRKVETGTNGHDNTSNNNSERGRSPPIPAARHRSQGQLASSSPPPPPPPPPPVLEFVPYVRTDEVFSLDPLEPADTPPPLTHSAPPPPHGHHHHHHHHLLHPELLRNKQTLRQQEILRGLAQLRQGLLQKQRELETDLKRHDNEHRSPPTTR